MTNELHDEVSKMGVLVRVHGNSDDVEVVAFLDGILQLRRWFRGVVELEALSKATAQQSFVSAVRLGHVRALVREVVGHAHIRDDTGLQGIWPFSVEGDA